MEFEATAVVTGLVCSGIGSAGTVIVGYIKDRRTAKQQEINDARAAKHGESQQIIDALSKRIDTVEEDHAKCMTEHAETKRQLGILEGRFMEMKESVSKGVPPSAAA